MQPETLAAHVKAIRWALPPRMTGDVPAILPPLQMRAQAGHEAVDALVVEVERGEIHWRNYKQVSALLEAVREDRDGLRVEVERLTAELEGLKSKLGDGRAVRGGGEPTADTDIDVLRLFVRAVMLRDTTEGEMVDSSAAMQAANRLEDTMYFLGEKVNHIAPILADQEAALRQIAAWNFREGLAIGYPGLGYGGVSAFARDRLAELTSTAGDERRHPDPASPLEGHETGPGKQTGDDTVVSGLDSRYDREFWTQDAQGHEMVVGVTHDSSDAIAVWSALRRARTFVVEREYKEHRYKGRFIRGWSEEDGYFYAEDAE